MAIDDQGGDGGTPQEPKQEAGNTGEGTRLIQIEFPKELTPFVLLAMGMGFLLVIVFFACVLVGLRLGAERSLLLSAGIAIILAAFGGHATVTGKAFVLAGVAALAGVLAGFLEVQRAKDTQRDIDLQNARAKEYVRGLVSNIPKPPIAVSLAFGESVVGSSTITRPDLFSFAVFADQANESNYASLRLQPPDETVQPLIAIPIAVACFQNEMGGAAPLDWKLRQVSDTWEVIDQRNHDRVVGRWGGERAQDCESSVAEAAAADRWFGALFSWSAFAQDDMPTVSVPSTLQALESEDTTVRRAARDMLSAATPAQVPDVLEPLREQDPSYRTKLGIAVALTEMLRRDKSQNGEVADTLTEKDRNLLLDLAGDSDRTLRIYATEFLYDLGDPEVTKLAIERAATTTDDSARYNWLFAAGSGWQLLDENEKRELKPAIAQSNETSGAKTKELIRKLE